MSILSSRYFALCDLQAIINRSNHFVLDPKNSMTNTAMRSSLYEKKYYTLITRIHRFCPTRCKYQNNGLWRLRTTQLSPYDFKQLFKGAWIRSDRNNNFENGFRDSYVTKAYEFIKGGLNTIAHPQITLLCPLPHIYLEDFIRHVFGNNMTNTWKTLVYFSKFISSFLPDLCIPVDSNSIKHIMNDYRSVFRGNGTLVEQYISFHEAVHHDLIMRFGADIMRFTKMDSLPLVGGSKYISPLKVPLNRPIDKIYYSVP